MKIAQKNITNFQELIFMYSFKCANYTLNLGKKTYIMGILNITDDSFFDGGRYLSTQKAIYRALQMQEEGADIIDVGAQSTRPGFKKISAADEWDRLKNVIPNLAKMLKIPISVDTFSDEVALNSLKSGASIINDVNGFKNEKMWQIASKFDCGCVIMHNGKWSDAKNFFESALNKAKKLGIMHNRICFDPGFGFGKSFEENINALKNLKSQKIVQNALLIGLSRKSFIGQICGNIPPGERLSGTLVANAVAALNGADIIRVHDVKEHVNMHKILKSVGLSHNNI